MQVLELKNTLIEMLARVFGFLENSNIKNLFLYSCAQEKKMSMKRKQVAEPESKDVKRFKQFLKRHHSRT